MSGWLPKEVLDHLTHAGYVAVPKERIELFQFSQDVDQFEMMRSVEPAQDISREVAVRLSLGVGRNLMERGFMDLEIMRFDETRTFRHRASIHVLKPRTITKED